MPQNYRGVVTEMKSYTVQVVIGNVYEITVTADTLEQAQDLALEIADDGEIIEAGRAVLEIAENN